MSALPSGPSSHYDSLSAPEVVRHDAYTHVRVTEEDARYSETAANLLHLSLVVHAEGYRRMGFVTQDAILPDGTMHPDLDKSRGPRTEYRLAINPEDESDVATMRKVSLPRGGTFRDLPSYEFCRRALGRKGHEVLRGIDHADARLKELAALAGSPKGIFELIREEIQESMSAEGAEEADQVLFFSIVTTTFDSLVRRYGGRNFIPIGDDARINDSRVGEQIALRPTIVIPRLFLDNLLTSLNEAEGRERGVLAQSFLYMTDGLPDERLSLRLREARRSLAAEVADSLPAWASDDHATGMGEAMERLSGRQEPWQQPRRFDLSSELDRRRVNHMIVSGEIARVVDPIAEIADDLYELRHPDAVDDAEARARFRAEIMAQGDQFGRWFYFPWSQSLVRYPNRQDHQMLRTARNRNLVKDAEQRRLLEARVGVFGLSVGRWVAEQLVMAGIGREMVLADPDRVTPFNINRIGVGMPKVGMSKMDIVAQEISEIDPYIEQVHLPGAMDSAGLRELGARTPELVFDEMDSMEAKARLRAFAREHRIPVVMVTDLDGKTLVDVERYDQGTARPFGGRISEQEFQRLCAGQMSAEELTRVRVKIIGVRNVTPRMLESVMDASLGGGLPQLGSTATVGGAVAAVVARDILLGRRVDTGRHVVNPSHDLRLQPERPALGRLIAYGRFAVNSSRQRRRRQTRQ